MMKIRQTTSKDKDSNPGIKYLEQVQGIRHVLKLFDSRIDEDYTFLITEKPKLGRISDLILKTHHFNSTENILAAIKDVLMAVTYVHFKGVIHGNIKPNSLYIRADHSIALGEFNKAVAYNTFFSRNRMLDYPDPYVVRAMYDSQIHFDEKFDIWSIGELVYYMIHKSEVKIESRVSMVTPSTLINTVTIMKGVDMDLLNILDSCLKIRPSLRISILELHRLVYDALTRKRRIVSITPFVINLDDPLPHHKMSVLEKFSELIFVMFLVLMVIPLTVYLISNKIKSDEEEEARREAIEQVNSENA